MTESKLWHFLVNCFRSSRCFAHLEQIHDGSYRARDAKVRGGFQFKHCALILQAFWIPGARGSCLFALVSVSSLPGFLYHFPLWNVGSMEDWRTDMDSKQFKQDDLITQTKSSL